MHAAVRSWRISVNKPVPSYSPVPSSGAGRLLAFILVGALVVGDSVGDGGDCSLVNKLVSCAHLKMEGLRAVELHLAGRGGEGVRLSGVWRGAATIPLAGRGGEGGEGSHDALCFSEMGVLDALLRPRVGDFLLSWRQRILLAHGLRC